MDLTASTDVLKRIKGLIIQTAQLPLKDEDIRDSANLFDECGLDSVSIVRLVLGIEQCFGIDVSDGDLNDEVLQTPATIAAWVGQKLAHSR